MDKIYRKVIKKFPTPKLHDPLKTRILKVQKSKSNQKIEKASDNNHVTCLGVTDGTRPVLRLSGVPGHR